MLNPSLFHGKRTKFTPHTTELSTLLMQILFSVRFTRCASSFCQVYVLHLDICDQTLPEKHVWRVLPYRLP